MSEVVSEPPFRSGFVTFVGRPNVGKSSLVNAICGQKVSIVSDKPQTTRHRIMGVLTRPDAQLVFVDTPGLHKPVTALGERVNATAIESTADVDVQCLVLDATMPFGKGDRWVAGKLHMPQAIVIVNKTDIASADQVVSMLAAAGVLDAEAYFPVSAKTGEGIGPLVEHLTARLPEGHKFFPDDELSDMPQEQFVAELVREQLLAVTRDELPYSIATRVTEWEWPRDSCRHHRRTRQSEGHGDRQRRQCAQGGRHAGTGSDAGGRVPRTASEGRQGLATPS